MSRCKAPGRLLAPMLRRTLSFCYTANAMLLPKLATVLPPGSAMRRARGAEPTLRCWIARSEAELQVLLAARTELQGLRIEPDDLVFPMLLESWDGGSAWSSSIDLGSALAGDWEAV